tara:strand:- start:243 stop:488 length:246 start_codon:yes stop_codon:yes gene_type:complete
MEIEKNTSYMEGKWVAKSMNQYIEKTIYKTLEEAIVQKTILVEKFESDFGYSRKMNDHVDVNYFFNVGLLDGLKKIKEEKI